MWVMRSEFNVASGWDVPRHGATHASVVERRLRRQHRAVVVVGDAGRARRRHAAADESLPPFAGAVACADESSKKFRAKFLLGY